MPSDPVVYKDEADAGKMRHTYTGIRASFPNRGIHYIIVDSINPLRRELAVRPEAQQHGRWEMNLVTTVQQGLTDISDNIKKMTNQVSEQMLGASLADRVKKKQDYIDRANSLDVELEELAKDRNATHSDEALGPANARITALNFDYTGADANYPQPTPGRFPNAHFRAVISELDHLVVTMTNSASADHPRTINVYDAMIFQTILSDIFNIVENAGSLQQPVYPTGYTRAQLDGMFNADGTYDPDLNEGSGRGGDVAVGNAPAQSN